MIGRFTGACIRGGLAGITFLVPYLLLPGEALRAVELASLFACLTFVLVLAEYTTESPSLIEFRDAPPLNRIRFITFFLLVFLLSISALTLFAPTNLTLLVSGLSALLGTLSGVDFSPVHLTMLMTTDEALPIVQALIGNAAALAYTVSLLGVAVFVILLRLTNWPTRSGPFNVWVNLPFFDPGLGDDVVKRLQREARLNIALGFILPFVLPLLGAPLLSYVAMQFPSHPQGLIWVLVAWSFLPANLVMRGVAMMRVAELIHLKRLSNSSADEEGAAPNLTRLWQSA